MISLELLNKNFSKNDKWPLLFVIAEIFVEEANSSNPITNLKAVEIAEEKYNLKIERRTVAQYKKILEQYFGFVFQNKGHGYYLNKKPEALFDEKQIEGVEYYKSNGFSDVHRKIRLCNEAIKNEKYVKYTCPEYIFKSLKVDEKRIKLIPIRVISVDSKYFLFAYAIAFKDYFYVNLDKSIINKTRDLFSSFKKKKELFAFKDYFASPCHIVTGRIGILDKIKIEPQYGYSEDFCSFHVYKTKPFFPESIVSLKEKYGEENIYGYEDGPFAKEDVDEHGAEYDDDFLDIHVPYIME